MLEKFELMSAAGFFAIVPVVSQETYENTFVSHDRSICAPAIPLGGRFASETGIDMISPGLAEKEEGFVTFTVGSRAAANAVLA